MSQRAGILVWLVLLCITSHYPTEISSKYLYFRTGRVAPYKTMRKLCLAYSGIPANPSVEDMDEYLDVVNNHPVFLGVRYIKGQIDAEQQKNVNFKWAPWTGYGNNSDSCVALFPGSFLEYTPCGASFSIVCAIDDRKLSENHIPEEELIPENFVTAGDTDEKDYE
ncbi:hypothetical protein CRM22_009098 [Opisthorchis felineus]|uniref:C-type lectin domain-containing protein n=1 Tax=Opisthorchis felineus TaxID=147828 RepID=A0A4S2L8B5_OPIFE|nr:hypothetical protein CRM22_009098 [Opisthorchis felineus]